MGRSPEEPLELLRAEFLEWPALSVVPGQVATLLDVDPGTAQDVLQTLVAVGFLVRTAEGRFALSERYAPATQVWLSE